jgi:cytochrome b6-f complex iron-sulfur subunit
VQITRRRLLEGGLRAVGAAALTGGLAAMFQFRPARAGTALRSLGKVDTLQPGDVKQYLVDGQRVWLVRQEHEVYALCGICTHLGCNLRWLPFEDKFKCPCHGSGFRRDGENFEGPALRPLERVWITNDGGEVVVDVTTRLRKERGEWTRLESSIRL